MPRAGRIAGYVVLAVIALFVINDYLTDLKKRRALAPVFRFGGTCGSIPFEPLGTEYLIRFDRPLTSDELDRLAELNTLRGSVAVMFYCEITSKQIELAKQRLPECDVYQVDEQGRREL